MAIATHNKISSSLEVIKSSLSPELITILEKHPTSATVRSMLEYICGGIRLSPLSVTIQEIADDVTLQLMKFPLIVDPTTTAAFLKYSVNYGGGPTVYDMWVDQGCSKPRDVEFRIHLDINGSYTEHTTSDVQFRQDGWAVRIPNANVEALRNGEMSMDDVISDMIDNLREYVYDYYRSSEEVNDSETENIDLDLDQYAIIREITREMREHTGDQTWTP